MGEIVLFQDAERKTNVNVRFDGDTVWLTQNQMADLFQKDARTISDHIRHVYEEGELTPDPTHRFFRLVQFEGKRQVERDVAHYNLDAIISVGYRVNSVRTTQFRQWATQTLKDNLVKSLTLNHQRLAEQCLDEAQELISLLSRALLRQENLNEENRNRQVLALIWKYRETWKALAQYDDQN